LPANATSSSFNCDLSGQVSGDGATVSCEPVQCNSSISIPNVVHTCSDVFVNRSCFAYCREGFQLTQPEVPEWTCTDAAGGLPAVSDVPMVDGYTLRGAVPVCSALPCLYNLPFGAEYADDCAGGVVTDGTCTVTCAAGWQGGSSTWTCMPDGVLNGTYPECLEITSTATSTTKTATTTVTSVTTTSTTYWNGTVLFSGYLDLTPVLAGRRLQMGRSELNEGFLNDTLSAEGLAHALAELLDTSEADVEINLTLGISNATQEEVVRPFYNAYRPFYTSEEAAEFASNLSAYLDSKPHAEVVSVFNSKLDLVDSAYRIGELQQMLVSFDQGSAFVVEVRIVPPEPVVEPEEEDNNVQWLIGALIAVVVCACLLCFLYWIWNKDREETEKRYAEPSPAAPATAEQPKDVSTMSGLVPGAKEAKPAVGEVLVEMSALQEALDEVGICFDSDEDEGGAAAASIRNAEDGEMKRMMQEAGVSFGEELSNDGENLQVAALPSNEEGLADMLALAGVMFEDAEVEEQPDVVLAIGDDGEDEFRI